jgi:hypothetical protein
VNASGIVAPRSFARFCSSSCLPDRRPPAHISPCFAQQPGAVRARDQAMAGIDAHQIAPSAGAQLTPSNVARAASSSCLAAYLWNEDQRGKSVNHRRCDDHTRKPSVRRHRFTANPRSPSRESSHKPILYPKPRSLASFAENFHPSSYQVVPGFCFLLRNVEEELPHNRAVAREVTLEAADVLKALIPDVLCDASLGSFCPESNSMHAHDEGLLMLRLKMPIRPRSAATLYSARIVGSRSSDVGASKEVTWHPADLRPT